MLSTTYSLHRDTANNFIGENETVVTPESFFELPNSHIAVVRRAEARSARETERERPSTTGRRWYIQRADIPALAKEMRPLQTRDETI